MRRIALEDLRARFCHFHDVLSGIHDRITLKSGFLVDSLDKEIRKNEMKWIRRTKDNTSGSSDCTLLSVLRIFHQGLYQTCDVLYQPRPVYPTNHTAYHIPTVGLLCLPDVRVRVRGKRAVLISNQQHVTAL